MIERPMVVRLVLVSVTIRLRQARLVKACVACQLRSKMHKWTVKTRMPGTPYAVGCWF